MIVQEEETRRDAAAIKAEAYLRTDEVNHIDMLNILQQKQYEEIVIHDQGILIQSESLFYITGQTREVYQNLIEGRTIEAACPHQNFGADYLQARFNLNDRFACQNAYYSKKTPIIFKQTLMMKPLSIADLDFVATHYHTPVGREYICARLQSGVVIGAFEHDECVGFIGEHDEGSMGMLEILPKFQRHGYASQCLCYKVNQVLAQQRIPFSQIALDNDASRALHLKLGFVLASQPTYWMNI